MHDIIEIAWLIESRFSHGDARPRWWMGTPHPAPWTTDSLEAVRFCRRRDAEAAAATLPDTHMVFVSEHQWGFGDYDGPRQPEPADLSPWLQKTYRLSKETHQMMKEGALDEVWITARMCARAAFRACPGLRGDR